MERRLIFFCSFLIFSHFFVSAQDWHHDTVPHTMIIPIKQGFVLPESKTPDSLCNDLKVAWTNYANTHKELVAEFVNRKDSGEYIATFVIEISKTGKVRTFEKLKHFTKIEKVCYDALNKVVKASAWHPSYQKVNNGKQLLNTRGKLYISIGKKTFSAWIASTEIGIHFFECKPQELQDADLPMDHALRA